MMKQWLMTTLALLTLTLAGPVMAKDYPEFGGRCAMGVAMGKEVKTDCTVTWNSPSGDKFCFGNKQAKQDFMKNKAENMDKAFRNYDQVVEG